MLPDPGFLFLSKKHQAALTLLEYGLLNHVGFCVISGEAGSGKTTILRALLERVPEDVTVGLITNTHQSFGGLLDWVLSVFDLHRPDLTHVEMHQVFMEFLIDEYANNRTVLLIVDEAQNMNPDALEELRMLSNVNSEKDQLLQVVLAGQPVLKETLRLPELMQFAQRIAVDYHLESLGLKETCGYIQHRLVTAGAEKDVFTPAACERIHNFSGGTPRLINLLCETVLVYGFADQKEMIDVALVDEMVLERMKDSVVPIVNRDVVNKIDKTATKELEKDFPWIQPRDGKSATKPEATAKTTTEETQKTIDENIKPVAKKDVQPVSVEEKIKKDDQQNKVIKEPVSNKSSLRDRGKSHPPKEKVVAATEKSNNSLDEETSSKISEQKETRKQLIKYGAIAVVFSLILIVSAVVLNGDSGIKSGSVDLEKQQNPLALQLQPKQEKEQEQKNAQLKQLQLEAEALKKERDDALIKMENEKLVKQEAEKQAAEKAALAVAAEEKRQLEDKKRLANAKARERREKRAAEKVKAEAKRIEQQRAKLEEEKRMMNTRLEEEIRLKKQEEARLLEAKVQRLELELKQKQLQEQEEKAQQQAITDGWQTTPTKDNAECEGPASRFKSGCR